MLLLLCGKDNMVSVRIPVDCVPVRTAPAVNWEVSADGQRCRTAVLLSVPEAGRQLTRPMLSPLFSGPLQTILISLGFSRKANYCAGPEPSSPQCLTCSFIPRNSAARWQLRLLVRPGAEVGTAEPNVSC